MSNKSLLILFLVTILIIIAAGVTSVKRAPQTVIDKTVLSDELNSRINDVAQIFIESENGSLNIIKLEENWGVMQADNYPARFEKVKKLVIDAAELNVISPKTNKPELFRELGLDDPDQENSRSTLLTFRDVSGNDIETLVIGKQPSAGELYVRIANTNNTYLVEGQLDLSIEIPDWIVRDLVDISEERIMEVIIEHPDGETLTLRRQQGEEVFTLTDAPPGRKPRSQYFTNQPATFLAKLSIENARSQGNFTYPDTPVKTTFRSYDGLVATVYSAKIDSNNYASMEFSIDENLLDSASGDEQDEAIVIGEQEPELDVRQEVDELNEMTSDWVFMIPQSNFLLLTKRTSELTDIIEDTATQ
jgi:hypothetical protein